MQPVPLKLKHYVKNVTIRYTTNGTDPDSVKSSIYKDVNSMIINKNLRIKAKAFKPGWISSDVTEQTFYKAGFLPDSAQLAYAPDPQFKGDGPQTLFDTKKGSLNIRDGRWLGYRHKMLEAIFYLNKPESISSVTVSSITDIGNFSVSKAPRDRSLGWKQPGNSPVVEENTASAAIKRKACLFNGL